MDNMQGKIHFFNSSQCEKRKKIKTDGTLKPSVFVHSFVLLFLFGFGFPPLK